MTKAYLRASTPANHPNPPVIAKRDDRWFEVIGRSVRELPGMPDTRHLSIVAGPFTTRRVREAITAYLDKNASAQDTTS